MMRRIPVLADFDHARPIGHVVLAAEYTRRCDYVLAIGHRGAEVMEFGLIPDINYRAYLENKEAGTWIRRPALPPVYPEQNRTGFYPDEQTVMDKLMEAYTAFQKLDREHQDEMREFVDGIHLCQNVLGMRVLRRAVPTGWPTYKLKEDVNADSNSRSAESSGGPADA